jgi:glycosyltransferase involved in cell wall biosynthesis
LERVLYLGQVGHNQLFPIIQGAYAVTLPSLADNFPNACLEAMACGKIVIGTLGNGFDQLIDAGKNGYVVEAGNTSALFQAMDEAMALPAEIKLGWEAAAQKRIAMLHPTYKVKELLDYYTAIISQHHH